MHATNQLDHFKTGRGIFFSLAACIDNRGGRRDWKRAYRSVVTSRRMIDTARPLASYLPEQVIYAIGFGAP